MKTCHKGFEARWPQCIDNTLVKFPECSRATITKMVGLWTMLTGRFNTSRMVLRELFWEASREIHQDLPCCSSTTITTTASPRCCKKNIMGTTKCPLQDQIRPQQAFRLSLPRDKISWKAKPCVSSGLLRAWRIVSESSTHMDHVAHNGKPQPGKPPQPQPGM